MKPLIREIQPTYGTPGTVVRIMGKHFGAEPGKVFFGSIEADADFDAKKKAAKAVKDPNALKAGETQADKTAEGNKLVADKIEAAKHVGVTPSTVVPQVEKTSGGVTTGMAAGVPIATRNPQAGVDPLRIPAAGGGTSAAETYPAGSHEKQDAPKDHVDSWSDELIVVCVPEDARPGDVVVLAHGESSNGSSFTVTAQ
jgi:hypothetical protein